ncbi:hypothetical protein LCGC14_0389190 [marine sediment metagenome]|uniref:Carboxypeptidase regulatory-like domain-containing protein n=1 Tax=marine sediment metagenome TaxID=412755 RepID=A0A0F9W943_9ZZZZ|nr:carboxypeptidase regulatory-like domain-containing protein [Phycisphaerae bacterium]HDZ43896.1 carboxypeptidase regulatory-like domain-containing protein [Phycisphaerae bacterium]
MTPSASSPQGRSLAANPSLHQLRTQAKDILKAHHAGDASCCEILRKLSRLAAASDDDILATELQLKDAQFALAMHYGFESWAAMKAHVQAVAKGKIMSAVMFGRVTAEDGGEPIEDAEVRVESVDEWNEPLAFARVQTGPDGRYECNLEWSGVNRPEVACQVRHVGYATKAGFAGEADGTRTRRLRMQDGHRHEKNITLESGFTFELTTVDEDGLPVEGSVVAIDITDENGGHDPIVNVMQLLTGRPFEFEWPRTDVNGFHRFMGVPLIQSAVYEIDVKIEHPQYGHETLRRIESLPRDGAVARTTVVLQRRSSLIGQVVCAETGQPIEGVTVSAYAECSQQEELAGKTSSRNLATTDSDGRFEIHGLMDRPHRVTARHSGWAVTMIGSVDVPPSEPLVVRMERGRVVRGRVLDRAGKRAVGAVIRAGGRASRSVWDDAVTDEAGRFEIGGLSTEGPVWLAAQHEGPYEAFGLVRVDPNDEPHVVFDGREMVELDGQVLDERGQPVPAGVECTVYGETDDDLDVFLAAPPPLAAAGKFRALLPPNGDLLVTLGSKEGSSIFQFFNAEHITMQDGRPNRSLTVTAIPGNKLRLRFLDSQSGQPVPKVDVTLATTGQLWSFGGWRASCDQDGVVAFEHMPPGGIKLQTVAPGHLPIEQECITTPTGEEIVVYLTPRT